MGISAIMGALTPPVYVRTNNEAVKAANDATDVNIELPAITEKGDKKDLLASSA